MVREDTFHQEQALVAKKAADAAGKPHRPIGVRLIAGLLVLGMLIGAALLAEPVANGSKVAAALMTGYTLAIGTLALGLLRLKEWARKVTQAVFAAVSAIVVLILVMVILHALKYGWAPEDPVEMALYGGFGLVSLLCRLYLRRPAVKGAFGAHAQL